MIANSSELYQRTGGSQRYQMRYGWKRTGMYVNNRSWNSGARLETERKSCVARSGERMAAHHDPKSAGELPASLLT